MIDRKSLISIILDITIYSHSPLHQSLTEEHQNNQMLRHFPKTLIFMIFLFACSNTGNNSLLSIDTQHSIPNFEAKINFDPQNAYDFIKRQMSYGPRTPGSEGHKLTQEMIVNSLSQFGWQIDVQEGEMNNLPVINIAGKREGDAPWIILGAHYDTRIFADQSPVAEQRNQPVPGANDGASGVAVLLELARVIPIDLSNQIWIVFFDAEDNGGINNLDWIMGSQFFVNSLNEKPDKMILLDMIGDENLEIYYERNSDQELSEEIWDVAASLGYESYFIDEPKYRLIDDHVPFLRAGIPAIDIIDFDYEYWHTTSDTTDKIDVRSLEIVGNTILTWLLSSSQ